MNRPLMRSVYLSFLLLAASFVLSCSSSPGSQDVFPAPSTPSLTAKARHQSVQLAWSEVDNAEGYLIYWSPTPEGTRAMADSSFVTEKLSFNHEGLKNGQTYYYAVAAWKGSKSEKSAEIAATPQSKPDTPQQIIAVAHDAEVALTWQPASNATSYQVQTVNDSGVMPASVVIAETKTSAFESRDLKNGTRYYFVVTASNDYGDSDASQKIYATPTSFLSLAAGRDHSCVLKTDHSIKCWGGNTRGQLANSAIGFKPQAKPVPITGEDWQVLAAGAAHNCGVKSDRTLWCWGDNSSGQLGSGAIGPNASAQMKQEVSSSRDWSAQPNALALGAAFSCALKVASSDGNTLWCWGNNSYGQLGIPSSPTRILQPLQVGVDSDWASVFAGTNHVCGIKTTRALFCWGRNDYKQLGRGGYSGPIRPDNTASSLRG